MADAPKPIKEYVLWIHDSVDNEDRDPSAGFKRRIHFASSSSPFPVPHVGDEIALGTESRVEVRKASRAGRRAVVSRVAHYLEIQPDGLVHHLDVYTEGAPAGHPQPRGVS